jgi:large subunit ribosomal protein L15
MKLHQMTNVPGARRRAKRVGCGEASGHGKTSGRGNKGQMSRSGHKRKPAFEGGQMRLIRRMPKRGFNQAYSAVMVPVNLSALAGLDDGAVVNEATLRAAGLVRGHADGIKILGGGELAKKLTVTAHKFSASARAKIEAAGGTCVTIA